ncbi:MAG: hypothetical protein ACK4Z8_02455 [Novosphingobium sp.]
MQNECTYESIKISDALREKLNYDECLNDAYVIWGDISRTRNDILLGGKNQFLLLIYARFALTDDKPEEVADAISDILGIDVFEMIMELVDQYDGKDPDQHLWHKTASGSYCVH